MKVKGKGKWPGGSLAALCMLVALCVDVTSAGCNSPGVVTSTTCTKITGDVTIQTGGLILLDSLVEVTGSLTVIVTSATSAARFGSLATVGGSLKLYTRGPLSAFQAWKLRTVGGDVVIESQGGANSGVELGDPWSGTTLAIGGQIKATATSAGISAVLVRGLTSVGASAGGHPAVEVGTTGGNIRDIVLTGYSTGTTFHNDLEFAFNGGTGGAIVITNLNCVHGVIAVAGSLANKWSLQVDGTSYTTPRTVSAHSCAPAYTWLTSAPPGCEGGCGLPQTVVYGDVKCVDESTQVVDEALCDEASRPSPQSKVCTSTPLCAWNVGEWSSCDGPESCGEGKRWRQVVCGGTTCPSPKPETEEKCDLGACEWIEGKWSACSPVCGAGERQRTVTCEGSVCSGPKPTEVGTCTNGPCPEWETGEWTACSVVCGFGTRTRSVECDSSLPCEGSEPVSKESCFERACEWIVGEWSGCASGRPDCGTGGRTRSVECEGKVCTSTKPPESQACSTSQCRWVPQAWSPCVSPDEGVECGAGERTRTYACENGLECFSQKPADETEACTLGACEWDTGEWSACSSTTRTCGTGKQTREVTCHDDSCPATERPSDAQPCFLGLCEWLLGEWSSCSNPIHAEAVCGPGTRTRTVQCEFYTDKPYWCPDPQPPGTDDCSLGECVWVEGEWGECVPEAGSSATCGQGVQSRSVTCTGALSECSSTAKPSTQQTCDLGPCDWVEGDWGICHHPTSETVTCGTGVQTRAVTCDGAQCPPASKPATEQTCDLGACDWIEGEWSACGHAVSTVTCGTGFRTRTVTCGGEQCPPDSQPVVEEACSLGACPDWVASGAECPATCSSTATVAVGSVTCRYPDGTLAEGECSTSTKPAAQTRTCAACTWHAGPASCPLACSADLGVVEGDVKCVDPRTSQAVSASLCAGSPPASKKVDCTCVFSARITETSLNFRTVVSASGLPVNCATCVGASAANQKRCEFCSVLRTSIETVMSDPDSQWDDILDVILSEGSVVADVRCYDKDLCASIANIDVDQCALSTVDCTPVATTPAASTSSASSSAIAPTIGAVAAVLLVLVVVLLLRRQRERHRTGPKVPEIAPGQNVFSINNPSYVGSKQAFQVAQPWCGHPIYQEPWDRDHLPSDGMYASPDDMVYEGVDGPVYDKGDSGYLDVTQGTYEDATGIERRATAGGALYDTATGSPTYDLAAGVDAQQPVYDVGAADGLPDRQPVYDMGSSGQANQQPVYDMGSSGQANQQPIYDMGAAGGGKSAKSANSAPGKKKAGSKKDAVQTTPPTYDLGSSGASTAAGPVYDLGGVGAGAGQAPSSKGKKPKRSKDPAPGEDIYDNCDVYEAPSDDEEDAFGFDDDDNDDGQTGVVYDTATVGHGASNHHQPVYDMGSAGAGTPQQQPVYDIGSASSAGTEQQPVYDVGSAGPGGAADSGPVYDLGKN